MQLRDGSSASLQVITGRNGLCVRSLWCSAGVIFLNTGISYSESYSI